MEDALIKTVKKHIILRSTFIIRDGVPQQQVQSSLNFEIRIEDLSSIDNAGKDELLQNKIYQEAILPFELEKAPLFRAVLYVLDDNKFLFQFVIHHIVCDGISLVAFFKELSFFYNSLISNEEAPNVPAHLDYADYVLWQQQWENSTEYFQQLEYWQKSLKDLPAINLPLDYKRSKVNAFTGRRYSFRLSEQITSNLKELSQTYGVTVHAMVLTIFQVLLSRYCGQVDFGIGVPVANRSKREFRDIFGIFVNVIVIRGGLEGDPTFEEQLRHIWEKLKEGYSFHAFPFNKLVSVMQNQRNSNYNPLFQVMLDFRDFEQPVPQFQSTEIEQVAMDTNTSKVDISLIITKSPKELFCTIEYNDRLFHPSTIERMGASFLTIIDDVLGNPRQKIGLLSLLREEEFRKTCDTWNQTDEEYPPQCVHELIEAQVGLTPDRTAICFEDQEISYKDLNKRANALARYLYRKNPNSDIPIGVCLGRSPKMIIALLAVLKSGHAYIPIDPHYPDERISFMVDDAAISLIITEKAYQSKFRNQLDQCIWLDEIGEVIEKEATSNLDLKLDLENLAYIIYTSGSTGKPKGVPLCHRSLSNLLYTMQKRPGMKEDDVVLAMASISFDMAVPEIYLPLITGAKIILVRQNEADLGMSLIKTLEQYGVTTMYATPTAYRILVESGWAGNRDLKVVSGGEGLPADLAKELIKRVGSVWNGYGPSEAIFSSFYQVGSNPDYNDLLCAPIGFAITNTQYYIVDSNLQIVPIGVAGELLIGGDCLSPGYLNRPQLTKEKFINNPWQRSAYSTLYRTGDLVRRLPDGNLEFLGRIDHQVKIRGYRIETEEIEAVLNEHEAVIQSVVIAKTYHTNDRRLVAYIVPRFFANANLASDLKNYLSLKLPVYMIPSSFCIIKKMPRMPNGKIDRKALPEEPISRFQTNKSHVEPQSDLQKAIASVWKEILQIREVDVNENFFDIGGNSLLIVFVANKLSDLLGQRVSVVTLFEYPTVKNLAEHLSKMEQVESIDYNDLQRGREEEKFTNEGI